MKLKPAAYVVRLFGGVRATARAAGRTPGAVCLWKKSAKDGGGGGKVPAGVRRTLLRVAKKRGLDLTSNDLDFGREVLRSQRTKKRTV